MLSKARWWGVWTGLLVTAALTGTPATAVGQRKGITLDPSKPKFDDVADAAYCPPAVLTELTSRRTGVQRTYYGFSTRGADAPFGKVYYTFRNMWEDDGYYAASGNWWLYGWECRLNNYKLLHEIIDLTLVLTASWTEVNMNQNGFASRCVDGTQSDQKLPDYDPYNPYDPDELDCYGDSLSGGGSGGTGGMDTTGCTIEHVVLEVSRDGGVTWKVMWEGDALVC